MTKEELLQKLTLVGMNHAGITTLDKPIIGTHSLATCLGILLYNEEKKIAIVAHATSGDPIPALDELFTIICKNKLFSVKFKYKIFDGYYKDAAEAYNSKKVIEEHFDEYIPFSKEEIPGDAILKNPIFEANEFYFDVSTGKFVTSEVLPLLQENISEKVDKPKHR